MRKIGFLLLALFVAALLCVSAAAEPNPVISRDLPAYSEKGDPRQANDKRYTTYWIAEAPDALAYDLSSVPESQRQQVLAVWYNPSTYDNICYQSKWRPVITFLH